MSPPALDGKPVLIVDDDDELRVTMADLVREEGWAVIEASNGDEALALAAQVSPGLIILDHRMPRRTGAEVYQSLRQMGVSAPVILVTAAQDVSRLAASLGVRCFLAKPFGLDRLISMIQQATQGGCGP